MNETDNIPADWVLLEAARRFQWPERSITDLHGYYCDPEFIGYRAFCDMIAKHEPNPIMIEARAIAADARQIGYERLDAHLRSSVAVKIATGEWDDHMLMRAAIKGIERGQELAVAQYKQERGNV